jgi:putative flippase GtrA
MHDAFARLWRLLSTDGGRKMLRYAMVSVVSTVMTFTVLGIVFGVFRLWTEVPSTIFANVVMIVPYYYLNRRWVWGKTGRSHWRRELLPFWGLCLWGIVLSIASATVARHISVDNHLSHFAATALLLSVTVTAFGVVWVIKFLLFNRMFKVAIPGGADTERRPSDVHRQSLESTPSGGRPAPPTS